MARIAEHRPDTLSVLHGGSLRDGPHGSGAHGALANYSSPCRLTPPRIEAGFDLVVADASWQWTERLFAPLADHGIRVLLIKACDWRTALSQGRPLSDWRKPLQRRGDCLWEQTLVLPPGWMKTCPRIGMRPIAGAIRRWRDRNGGRRPLAMAMSYPYYLYLRDQVRPDALIYYNMDDYTLYWSSRRQATVRSLERRAVNESNLSVFCAGPGPRSFATSCRTPPIA